MNNTYFSEKLHEAADEILDLTDDTIRFCGGTFLETFPATVYKLVKIDGKLHRMKVEVTFD